MLRKKLKKNNGITMIALAITIVIIIILAGVGITALTGNNGLIDKSGETKELQEKATIISEIQLKILNKELKKKLTGGSITDAEIEQILSEYGTVNRDSSRNIESITPNGKNYTISYSDINIGVQSYNQTKKVNEPQLLTGMTPIKFVMPTDTTMGKKVNTSSTDSDWYEYGTTYETKKWANAVTRDGSMWVWIPRFAYKIDSTNKKTDVVFLIGTTNSYYDNNEIKSAEENGYIVHPAFQNGTANNFANGEWDKELTGIWVAKFEAGYASGNNKAEVKASNVKYTKTTVWVNAVENGTGANASMSARNWLDGDYGSTKPAIKYPVFQGTTYSMNYMNHSEAYSLARVLTDDGNIYGFSKTDADSHLMKNSEWGAVAYLSASQYGLNGKEITINNININSGGTSTTKAEGNPVASVYAVTGCTTNSTNKSNVITNMETINSVTGNTAGTGGVYVWNQKTGQNASTTGTIYGIYDISGGAGERAASYIANGNSYLKNFGLALAYENSVLKTTSTKYATVYPNNEEGITNQDTACQMNFVNNTEIYGDAIRETTSSLAGTTDTNWKKSAWNSDYSIFAGTKTPFFVRGGYYSLTSSTGAFAFNRDNGSANSYTGFRVVLVAE